MIGLGNLIPWGNSDVHYLGVGTVRYSRHCATIEPDYKDVLLLYLIRIIEALLEIRALTT
jgi:hypothetical protein